MVRDSHHGDTAATQASKIPVSNSSNISRKTRKIGANHVASWEPATRFERSSPLRASDTPIPLSSPSKKRLRTSPIKLPQLVNEDLDPLASLANKSLHARNSAALCNSDDEPEANPSILSISHKPRPKRQSIWSVEKEEQVFLDLIPDTEDNGSERDLNEESQEVEELLVKGITPASTDRIISISDDDEEEGSDSPKTLPKVQPNILRETSTTCSSQLSLNDRASLPSKPGQPTTSSTEIVIDISDDDTDEDVTYQPPLPQSKPSHPQRPKSAGSIRPTKPSPLLETLVRELSNTTPKLHSTSSSSSQISLDSRPSSSSKPKTSSSTRTLTSSSNSKSPKKQSKKAQAAQRAAELERFAFDLYTQLNESVFEGKLPRAVVITEEDEEEEGVEVNDACTKREDVCRLVWSAKLRKTAGVATISRNRKTQCKTVAITLAKKVVDREERIMSTLPHEMCHLAVWLLSAEKDNGHGKCFKGWANRIMKTRKDIEITTRHSYEIVYKFEWECEKCGTTFGRNSKSIDPARHRCGACQGVLVPLFQEQRRAPSAYLTFRSEKLKELKLSRPDLDAKQRSALVGKLWDAEKTKQSNSLAENEDDIDGLAHRLGSVLL